MKIFSGNSNAQLGKKIAEKLTIPLCKLDIHIFPDGEKRVRILDSVVGEDCIVVQPTSPPVDQHYMELFFIIDGLKRSGAKTVTVVMPYVGYQRQDHVFRDGEAVSMDVVVKTMEAVGADKFIVFDLHSVRIEQVFTKQVVHLSALPIFAEKIKEIRFENAVLVSPDMGGGRRIKILSELLDNMPVAEIEKNRDLETGSINASIVHGELTKRAIIVDDMIASGGTIATAAKLLKEKGVEHVSVFATHAVFCEDASSVLQKSHVDRVYVTDTIFVPESKQFEKLEIISISDIIAHTLYENSTGNSKPY